MTIRGGILVRQPVQIKYRKNHHYAAIVHRIKDRRPSTSGERFNSAWRYFGLGAGTYNGTIRGHRATRQE